jgi:outer membrane lipoprotein-sorting protein
VLATAAASAGPARLLRAAEEADKRLSYTGVRVVRAFRGDHEREQRVRVWHLAPDRTRVEFLSPDGGNVLLERGSGRWFYARDRERWIPAGRPSSRSRFDLLLKNYRVRKEGEGTVAGRPVVQLVIEPRHPGNPTKRVWIDPARRMTLREEVRNAEGRITAASAFEQVELVQELSPRLFEPPVETVQRRLPPPTSPFAPLRPRYLPPGYQEDEERGLRRGPSEGVHLRYTDGLGTISLFQFRGKPGNGQGPHSAGERRGGRRGRPGPPPISRQIGDMHCAVFGDASPEELRKLLDSLPDRP